MENSKITFRPKGGLYLFAIITIYVFLLLLFTVFPISTTYLKKYILTALSFALGVFFTFLQTREIIIYKIDIYDNKTCIAANRAFMITYQKAFTLEYGCLKSMQLAYGTSFASLVMAVINFEYENGTNKYIDVNKFSKKQIYAIMDVIKQKAESYNGYEIEIKPEINGVKKKTNNKKQL